MRPQYFTLNRHHPLSSGLVFAGLGRGAHTLKYLDSSGYGYDGILTAMDPPTDWVCSPDLNRWVLDLDGSNDRVEHKYPNVGGWTEITLSLWLLMRSYDASFDVPWQGYYQRFQLYFNGTTLYGYFNTTAGTSIASAARPSANIWTHIVFQWTSGSGASIYLNGVVGTAGTSRTGSLVSTTDAFVQAIGAQNTSWAMDGKVADACIWNRRLLTSEIQILADRSDTMYHDWLKPNKINIARSPIIATTNRRPTLWFGSAF